MTSLHKARILSTVVLFCCLHTAISAPQHPIKTPPDRDALLKSFLAKRLKDDTGLFSPVRYVSAFVDLNGDGVQEALVYVTGGGWCGSGGCNLLILEPLGNTYRIITQTETTWPPIRVLTTKTNGWHDIGVIVAGGGIIDGYEAALSFNGRRYPDSPPARPLKANVPGSVLISRDAPQTTLNQ